MKGYAGKILRINLSTSKVRTDEVTESIARHYLGGNGFGAMMLAQEDVEEIEPLSASNILTFATGPLCGTEVPCASKLSISAISPLTGGFFDSIIGGKLHASIKYAGYDAIVIEGEADEPVFVSIQDDKITIEPAQFLWNKGTFDTQRILKNRYGHNADIACIGQAGENLVSYANIIHARRAAGRGGLGAVMGAKKLKAIMVQGSGSLEVFDVNNLKQWSHQVRTELKNHPLTGRSLVNIGTPATLGLLNGMGRLGTMNWQREYWEKAGNISGDVFLEDHIVGAVACLACTIGCSHAGKVKEGPYKGSWSEGPDYETLYALGSSCGIDDLSSIILADYLLDDYGMDTISYGLTLAFAMDCFTNGILNSDDLDGKELSFGNNRAMLELIHKTALNYGVGELFAKGSKKMAEQIGKEASKLAMQSKGLEIAGHSPRSVAGMGLGMATSARGGSHLDGRPTLEYDGFLDPMGIKGKGKWVAEAQKMTAVGDSQILCRMVEKVFGYTLDWNRIQGKSEFLQNLYVDPLKMVTGLDFDIDTLREVGERICTLERYINVIRGFNRKDDTLPDRILKEKVPDGPSEGDGISKEDLNLMLDEYYDYMGWSATGVPTIERLKKLKLDREAKAIRSLNNTMDYQK